MSIIRVLARLERDTLLPEDESINTWHFQGLGDFALPADTVPVTTALGAFYSAIQTTLASVLTGNVFYDVYDLADPSPRVPIATASSTFTPGSTSLPEEVAICSSFEGTPTAGLNQARRRGRVYLGPLSDVTDSITAGRVHVATATRTVIANATEDLADGSYSSAEFRLAVYSPTNQTATNVERGWVDDTFDTQRRRGPATQARTSWVRTP